MNTIEEEHQHEQEHEYEHEHGYVLLIDIPKKSVLWECVRESCKIHYGCVTASQWWDALQVEEVALAHTMNQIRPFSRPDYYLSEFNVQKRAQSTPRERLEDTVKMFNKDKKLIYSILLTDNESKKINIRICEDSFQLQIFCDLTWIPNLLIDSSDSRELGIGIFNVSIR